MKLHRVTVSLVFLLFGAPAFAQSASGQAAAVLKPADNLVTEGIPAIPAAIAEQAGRYTEVRSASVAD